MFDDQEQAPKRRRRPESGHDPEHPTAHDAEEAACIADGAAVADLSQAYLTYANIQSLIDRHLEERSLMLDVNTRFLLSRLAETAGQRAEVALERIRAEDEDDAGLATGRD